MIGTAIIRPANELRMTTQYVDTITDAFLRDLERAVPLHDIGKVAIPDRILFKPGRLTEGEMVIMRTHAAIGAQAIHTLVERVPGATFLRMAEALAHGHHEWYNGKGYPRGLSGPDMSLAARIAAVADVYDAVTTKRVYKDAMPHSRAAAIVREGCGTQFDPMVVQAFVNREEEFSRLAAELADAEPAEPALAEPALV